MFGVKIQRAKKQFSFTGTPVSLTILRAHTRLDDILAWPENMTKAFGQLGQTGESQEEPCFSGRAKLFLKDLDFLELPYKALKQVQNINLIYK